MGRSGWKRGSKWRREHDEVIVERVKQVERRRDGVRVGNKFMYRDEKNKLVFRN